MSAPLGYLTFAAESLTLARLFSTGYGFSAGFMIANIFAGAMDVTERHNYGASAGVLNSVGGVAATIIIFTAGLVKDSLGFAGLLAWVAVLCCVAAVVLAVVASRRFAAERFTIQPIARATAD